MAITIKINAENEAQLETLAEAREAILAAAKAAPSGRVSDIEVELSHGSYILTEPFELSEKENPELKNVKVTLKAAEGERPLVAAWHPVKGPFERVEGKPYYRCRLEKDENGNYPRFHDLYYKGKRLQIASSPMWVKMENLTKEDEANRGNKYVPGYR